MSSHARCPECGYTAEDAALHRDHHLCGGIIPNLSKEPAMEWFKTFDNVHALGQWLAERGDLDIRTVWYFLSKPWKWEEEWKEYQLSKEGT